ncbi:hypothetical protein [Paraglaciecola arctica]|uniref:Uncharacterized protein n=1 Tax=Paraglaciecola arctica BSs20135 TaxID=493475 RepID=K6Y5D9_9ALTE|nr:hypothetical protein [Paraglaciecola arctica]GAC19186.1 hypothetical protein GARC_2219 [Paraglaciecola arctica BSs20135]
MFNEHGEFVVTRQGNILIAYIYGAWNAETAKAYKHTINQTIEPLKGKSWALISNVQQWGLCTPDCELLMVELAAECRGNSLKREAIVNNNTKSVKLELFNNHSKQNPCEFEPSRIQFQRRFLETDEQAKVWLKTEGYSLK